MFLSNSFPWSKTKKIALYISVILLGIENRASATEADKTLKNNYIYESALIFKFNQGSSESNWWGGWQ